jgi:hypothetical protein
MHNHSRESLHILQWLFKPSHRNIYRVHLYMNVFSETLLLGSRCSSEWRSTFFKAQSLHYVAYITWFYGQISFWFSGVYQMLRLMICLTGCGVGQVWDRYMVCSFASIQTEFPWRKIFSLLEVQIWLTGHGPRNSVMAEWLDWQSNVRNLRKWIWDLSWSIWTL